MSSLIQLGTTKFLPVKEASEFVPYSRDYVARLAREGKIVATQIDRQWFVDVASLQNFFAHATIEESVRKRHLSSIRKRDLEVREVYRTRLAEIAQKHQYTHRLALMQTCLIFLCGIGVGFFYITANERVTPQYITALVRELRLGDTHESQRASVQGSTLKDVFTGAIQEGVIESDESFDVSRGIVLLPMASSSTSTVEDFFSDPVTVEMTSTTTGTIRNGVSQKSVPFVRVPAGAVVVKETNGGNVETP